MRSDLFSPQNAEAQMQQPGMKLQNGKMLKVELNGEMMVRQGAMVAYQGKIQFQGQGAGGIGKFVKQQLTGEGVPLMKCSGAVISSSPTWPPTSISSTSRSARRADHQRHQRARLRPDAVLRHPTWCRAPGCCPTPACSTACSPARAASRSPRRALRWCCNVDQPTYADPQAAVCWSAIAADRLPQCGTVRPRHADGPHHRRGVHDVVLRAGLRRRAAL